MIKVGNCRIIGKNYTQNISNRDIANKKIYASLQSKLNKVLYNLDPAKGIEFRKPIKLSRSYYLAPIEIKKFIGNNLESRNNKGYIDQYIVQNTFYIFPILCS